MLISLFLTILVAAAILLAAFYFYQHKLIFMPTSALEATPTEAGLAYEDIRVTVDAGELVHAWFMPASDPAAPVILFSHGNAGNISHRLETARFLHDLGAAVLMYDYRGYGLSEGSPSESNLYADAAAVYFWLTKTRGVRAERVYLMGRSLGGAVAVDLATRAACAGLIVESSFTSVPDMGKRLYPWLPIDWLARYRFDSERKLGSVPCPVLVLHSFDDEMIPFEMGQRLYAAAPEPKRFVQLSGGHNDLSHFNSAIYVNGLREFLGLSADGKTSSE
jgi:fermentation-respiration switch protein FrsA (DUF1100 family)